MTNQIDYQTGQIDLTFPKAPAGTQFDVTFMLEEPSAVDRLAALEDPDGEAAARVKAFEDAKKLKKSLNDAQDEIYRRTVRPPNQIIANPRVVHSILGGVQVTC